MEKRHAIGMPFMDGGLLRFRSRQVIQDRWRDLRIA